MHLHKFDTPTKSGHLHIWHGQPSTPEEWVNHWTKERGIWIPGSRGNRPVFLAIRHISPTTPAIKEKADYIVEAEDSKPFYIKFARQERAFSPLSRPTLVIPYCSMRQAWWLLSAN